MRALYIRQPNAEQILPATAVFLPPRSSVPVSPRYAAAFGSEAQARRRQKRDIHLFPFARPSAPCAISLSDSPPTFAGPRRRLMVRAPAGACAAMATRSVRKITEVVQGKQRLIMLGEKLAELALLLGSNDRGARTVAGGSRLRICLHAGGSFPVRDKAKPDPIGSGGREPPFV